MSKPFLDWAGKAERLSFEVPTLPLFVHERLSTKAILETLKGHKRDKQTNLDLFGDPERPIVDQVLKAYEYQDRWVNRMILGDSLIVMNSLLHYEGLGGQIQMIYMDPPYGVKFGSNFQPFVRRRDVSHNDDGDMTREPEMVQAYRDTWELGLHSYLTYLRDRLLLARDLLAASGSVFVQINEENVHHVRELLDEVFGSANAVVTIVLKKKSSTETTEAVNDFILWYARDRTALRATALTERRARPEDDPKFNTLLGPKGETKRVSDITDEQIERLLATGYEYARVNYPLVSQHYSATRSRDFEFKGKLFKCGSNKQWRYDLDDPKSGMQRLAELGRLFDGGGESLGGIARWSDWPFVYLSNVWTDLHGEKYPVYVVQTARRAVERCMLMTTKPGDLVFDPTCGSGTTAYVAEQWGRRWITADVSRVPLSLARQRLLTATYPYYELTDEARGPAGGFVYKRRQTARGEEVGGVVPHTTLTSIAKNEPPVEEVLVDRPEESKGVTRVTGPFAFEATIPTPVEAESAESEVAPTGDSGAGFAERMLDVLRKSPILRLEGNREVKLKNVRLPAKTLALSAEALQVNGEDRPVAFVFGPENGAVTEKLVFEAAREANVKGYKHLYVIGFAIQPNARQTVEKSEAALGIAATYVQASPDLLMGDLLKNMRSSQIFSVCGLPDATVRKGQEKGTLVVELNGVDVFDPITMKAESRKGTDVPCWLLDTDYNGLSFHVSQAFFPRTGAWDALKKALRAEYDEAVFDHLAGAVSAPFEPGEHRQVAVKVIDDRGNELLVVKPVR
ncbi:MAG TPA: DNA methyltransferase [Anaeromyxobacter sp.]